MVWSKWTFTRRGSTFDRIQNRPGCWVKGDDRDKTDSKVKRCKKRDTEAKVNITTAELTAKCMCVSHSLSFVATVVKMFYLNVGSEHVENTHVHSQVEYEITRNYIPTMDSCHSWILTHDKIMSLIKVLFSYLWYLQTTRCCFESVAQHDDLCFCSSPPPCRTFSAYCLRSLSLLLISADFSPSRQLDSSMRCLTSTTQNEKLKTKINQNH